MEVLIKDAQKGHEKLKNFENLTELIQWLKEDYSIWRIEFDYEYGDYDHKVYRLNDYL